MFGGQISIYQVCHLAHDAGSMDTLLICFDSITQPEQPSNRWCSVAVADLLRDLAKIVEE